MKFFTPVFTLFISSRKIIIATIFIMLSLITTSVQAWPEVDHMNMCGAASKVVRSYGGNFKGWNQHDRYIASTAKRYYAATGCPNIVSPVANKKAKKVKVILKRKKYTKVKTAKRKVKKRNVKRYVAKSQTRIKRSKKYTAFRNTVKYDEKADCARVDRMNSY